MLYELIEIHWTCGSIDEARKVSRFLIQERYVANAQIIPWIESIYLLDNKLETTQESKAIFKTISPNFERIKSIIQKNSKYEIPEILVFKIEGSSQEFDDWIKESILSKKEA